MVSSNGPPLPMPMQVAPGHMVQQIVDEHGILTNVILAPQMPGMPPGTPMTVGYYVCIYYSSLFQPCVTCPTHGDRWWPARSTSRALYLVSGPPRPLAAAAAAILILVLSLYSFSSMLLIVMM